MEPTNNSSSSTNTILIVILLLVVVGLGVYWFTGRSATPAPADNGPSLDIQITGDAAGTSEEGKTPADGNDTPETPTGGEMTP